MKSCLMLMMTILLLTGCWDHRNLPDILYVTALGVDYNNGEYEVYAQFADFSAIAHSEGGSSKAENLFAVGKGKGKTINMAVNDLYGSAQRRIFLSHIRSIILTENALKKSKGEYFDALQRYREFRLTAWVFATKDDMYTLLNAKPFFQMSPLSTLLGEPKDTYKQKSLFQPLKVQEYIRKVNEPGNTVMLPSLTINTVTWKKDDEPDEKQDYNGVFAIEKMNKVAFLSRENAIGLRWMNSATTRTPLELSNAVVSMEDVKSTISFQEATQKFNIKVNVKGNIVGVVQQESEDRLRREAQNKIKTEIEQTYDKGIEKGVDVYSLKYELYKSNKHRKAAEEVTLNKDSLNIQVKVELIHSGQIDFHTTDR